MAAPLLAALPEALGFVGTLSLPEAAALLQLASLFVGNDRLMHLSAAAGAPTIGLFGPTDASIYGPAGPSALAVVAGTMEAITVQRVVEAGRQLLGCAPGGKTRMSR